MITFLMDYFSGELLLGGLVGSAVTLLVTGCLKNVKQKVISYREYFKVYQERLNSISKDEEEKILAEGKRLSSKPAIPFSGKGYATFQQLDNVKTQQNKFEEDRATTGEKLLKIFGVVKGMKLADAREIIEGKGYPVVIFKINDAAPFCSPPTKETTVQLLITDSKASRPAIENLTENAVVDDIIIQFGR